MSDRPYPLEGIDGSQLAPPAVMQAARQLSFLLSRIILADWGATGAAGYGQPGGQTTMDLHELWDEQAAFNRLLREPASTFEERTALTKEYCLHMVSEIDELLRCCGAWKPWRRVNVLENRAAVRVELADILKLWIILCQAWDVTPEEAIRDFWTKSAVVRQRHSEEWIKSLDRVSVVVDIDNVLADYVAGFVQWGVAARHISEVRAQQLLKERPFINAEALVVSLESWRHIQHAFRTSGWWANLPVMPHAREFLLDCQARGWQIILLTSRRITDYPNIQSETVRWLTDNQLPYDFLWWAQEKSREVMNRMNPEFVRFVVDDDLRFIHQFEDTPIRAYWLANEGAEGRHGQMALTPYKVQSLKDVIRMEDDRA